MPEDRPLPPVSLREHREQTIEALCAHFAKDRLTLEDLENRLDMAQRAGNAADLDRLLHDLSAPGSTPSAEAGLPATRRAMPVDQKPRQTLLAIMGGVQRRGTWVPARETTMIAVMGGAELDFRDAQLGPGVTEITIFAFMGGIEIIVPPDLPVDIGGVAIMGAFDHKEHTAPPTPDGPSLRVSGFVLMGGVDISVRLPGETKRDARQRVRKEGKLNRDEARRIRNEARKLRPRSRRD